MVRQIYVCGGLSPTTDLLETGYYDESMLIVNEHFDRSISIYPNPSEGAVTAFIEDGRECEWSWYDAHGRLIWTNDRASDKQ